MDKIVIDSGVAVKWYIPESYSVQAVQIMNDYQAGRLELLAPDLIYAEIGNVAWKKQRFQGLTASAARAIVTDCCALSLRGSNKMWRHVCNVPNSSARCKRAATSFCYSLLGSGGDYPIFTAPLLN
jgi:hypothetical protein